MPTYNCGDRSLRVEEKHIKVLGWPTDTVSIDYYDVSENANTDVIIPKKTIPHLVLVFVPGNPGQYNWYLSDLIALIKKLGRGYAARAISHAGHSLGGDNGIMNVTEYAKNNPDADTNIPWTMQGQILHKSAFMTALIAELREAAEATQEKRRELGSHFPHFLFLGHSFGCYVVQKLCLMRPDILDRTLGFLHLMPFFRMKADYFNQLKLNLGAYHPGALISLGTALSRICKRIPSSVVTTFIKLSISDEKTTGIAVRLLRQPEFVRNFFTLGTEEIRGIPKDIDITAFNVLGRARPIFMLFAGKDQWAPTFHMTDIARLQTSGRLTSNIYMTHLPELRHDYVSYDGMSSQVIGWCLQCIASNAMNSTLFLAASLHNNDGHAKPSLRSKL